MLDEPNHSNNTVDNDHLLEGVSQNEHPVHGIAFYNFHPCRTADLLATGMCESGNRVISLLSVIGRLVGYALPLDMLKAVGAIKQ